MKFGGVTDDALCTQLCYQMPQEVAGEQPCDVSAQELACTGLSKLESGNQRAISDRTRVHFP